MRAWAVGFGAYLSFLVLAPAASAQEFIGAARWGGSGDDSASGVTADGEGNVYVVGTFAGTVDFDPGPNTYYLTSRGGLDVFILKLDHTGALIWAGQVGSTSDDSVRDVAVDAGGNVYFVGEFPGAVNFDADPGPGEQDLFASGYTDAFIIKVNSTGSLIWAKQPAHTPIGSDSSAIGVAVDASGNVYTLGEFSGSADFDPGPGSYNLFTPAGVSEVFISKLNGAGNLVWAKQLAGALPFFEDPSSIVVDAGGNVYATGSFSGTVNFNPGGFYYLTTTAGYYDAFVLKLDSAGSFVWAAQMGGDASVQGFDLTIDTSGAVYVVGRFGGSADFDPGPGTDSLTSMGGDDAFICKLDGAGKLIWARQLGGSADEDARLVTVDTDGDVYTVGSFPGTTDFDPGPGTYTLTAAGGGGLFISKLDSAGSFVWAGQFGGPSYENASDVVLDAGHNLYTVGYFYETADFDPGPGTYNLTSAGAGDAFISKIGKSCPLFDDRSRYGQILFPPLCTHEAYTLTNDVYDTTQFTLARGSGDRFFLSATGGVPTGEVLGSSFTPLVVEDSLHVNGVDIGLGAYSYQPGVPPVLLYEPIETNLVPAPSPELGTDLIPEGLSTPLFELIDAQRTIYGHTAVYLVRDCGLWLAGNAPTHLNWITQENQIAGTPPQFDIRYGVLSQLKEDRDFSRASCLGHFFDTPATESTPDPPVGDGYYYMARGLDSCVVQGYGNSSLMPDPRDALDALPVCP